MADKFSEHRVEASLRLDPRRSAVLVVDMVNDFFEDGGAMVLPGGKELLYEPIRSLLDAAHENHVPVFWLNQHLRPDDTLFRKRVPHCLIGTWGAQIVEALPRADEDIIIPKRRYSGFFQTDLDLYLRERDIHHLIVSGCVTNICVRSTINDAYFLQYDVIVPHECVGATSDAAQEVHLYDIETHYGTVTTLNSVLAILRGEPTHEEADRPDQANPEPETSGLVLGKHS